MRPLRASRWRCATTRPNPLILVCEGGRAVVAHSPQCAAQTVLQGCRQPAHAAPARPCSARQASSRASASPAATATCGRSASRAARRRGFGHARAARHARGVTLGEAQRLGQLDLAHRARQEMRRPRVVEVDKAAASLRDTSTSNARPAAPMSSPTARAAARPSATAPRASITTTPRRSRDPPCQAVVTSRRDRSPAGARRRPRQLVALAERQDKHRFRDVIGHRTPFSPK